MNTKVIKLGKEKPSIEPIKFYKILANNGIFVETVQTPIMFNYIEIICENYGVCGDLLYAYNHPDSRHGSLFIGKVNSGLV